MNPSRTLTALLSVIAAGVVVIAAVLVFGALDREHSEKWNDARDEASESADNICSVDDNLELVEPTAECVEEKAAELLEAWESENPDDVWK